LHNTAFVDECEANNDFPMPNTLEIWPTADGLIDRIESLTCCAAGLTDEAINTVVDTALEVNSVADLLPGRYNWTKDSFWLVAKVSFNETRQCRL
jgi:hypothetical protein